MDNTFLIDSKSGTINKEISNRSLQLLKLFKDDLKDVYWAEKALLIELPEMIKNAKSWKLKKALKSQFSEIQAHINQIEKYFNYWQELEM